MPISRLAALLLALLVAACAPDLRLAGPPLAEQALNHDHWLAADGARLPVRSWLPEGGRPTAVVLALHGMNDYSNAFEGPGRFLAGKGIAVYAYDQRGFGQGPHPGYWSDAADMAADLRSAARLVAARHSGVPLYLLGESMGGAVAILAAADPPPEVKGLILSAPAVWGRSQMGSLQRLALWLATNTVPGWQLTGSGLRILASDNIEMLRALSRDPLVLKATRVDAINGLVDLMEVAYTTAARLRLPTLVLYGERDEVIPPEPTWRMVEHLPELRTTPGSVSPQRVALYDKGWHMLLRDLGAEVVLSDVVAWIADPVQPLPSGADARALAELAKRSSN
jgi:alpha-beta hydrolase superfamily lysophospholipase